MNTMLLHDFAYVPVSAERVCDRITAENGQLLVSVAAAAIGEGDARRLRLGSLGAVPMPAKPLRLQVGEPLKRDEMTVVPLTLMATTAPGFFPTMSADLEISPIAAELTQLTLRGRYEPPLEGIGRRRDRLLMHRIVEAGVRSFLGRLAATLTDRETVEANAPDNVAGRSDMLRHDLLGHRLPPTAARHG
jgi:hypothetical protein